jgi:hypothetical protein
MINKVNYLLLIKGGQWAGNSKKMREKVSFNCPVKANKAVNERKISLQEEKMRKKKAKR